MSGELVPVSEKHGNLDVLLPDSAELLAKGGDGLFSSMDKSNPDHQPIIIRALGIADKRVEEVLGETLKVCHVVAHNINPVDPATGEVIQTVRIVFVTTDGQTIAGSGKGLYNSLRQIIGVIGSPVWQPALVCKIKPITTRMGRRTYTIEVIGLDKPAKAAKEGK